jgi:surface antigen
MTGRKLARVIVAGIVTLFVTLSSAAYGPAWAVQCVPYARELSGINLHGAAWTWWRGANDQYRRGTRPAVGAALVFRRIRGMPSGHVAIVTEVVNDRMVRVSHANWVHHGHSGRIETDVAVVDESSDNDWSEVRVWYAPIHDYGVKVYPTYGFIYPPGSYAPHSPASMDKLHDSSS